MAFMDLLIKESDVNINFTHDEMRDEVSSMMAGVRLNYVNLL
jgi:hypothetical protein